MKIIGLAELSSYLFMYLIVSGTINTDSTKYMKTVHLTLKAIFFSEQYV